MRMLSRMSDDPSAQTPDSAADPTSAGREPQEDRQRDRLNAALEGRYAIARELGEGGMATVYLAEDLKHKRQVAIKVLKPELAAMVGAERFLAEIETTANLQHPHILPLYDSGEADGFLFFVGPYVEGESLRALLDRERQLPIDEALRITKAVASALDYAHRQGVVHRDIKPANILLQDGEPLLADFGIALAVQEAGGGRLTETGLSLGTPYYMSPEQASAERDPGARSDVYSLGCVLYEMLAGEPPFGGPTAQAVLAKILTADPARPRELRGTVPAHVDAAVSKAIQRIPADRFGSAADFARALEDRSYGADAGITGRGAARSGACAPRSAWSRGAWPAAGAALLLAFLAGWGIRAGAGPENLQVVRTSVVVEDGILRGLDDLDRRTNADRPSAPIVALSPDGRTLVFAGIQEGTSRLFRRPLDASESTPIEGTEGGVMPFFSPGGAEIGFWADGRLLRVPLEGGPPAEVVPMQQPTGGASWGDDDRIVFVGAGFTGLHRVAASGGEVEELPAHPGAHLPHVLPGSEAILYTVAEWPALEDRRVEVISVGTGEVDTLVDNASDARYLRTGHLVFARVGTLMTIPFDPGTLDVTGGPAGVLSDLLHTMNGANTGVWTDVAHYAVSDAGHLAYLTGGTTPAWNRRVAWLDRAGVATPVELEENFYLSARVQPDGERIAVSVVGVDPGVWVVDSGRGGGSRRISEHQVPTLVWTPTGESLVYSRTGHDSLFRVRADGSAPESPAHPIVGFPVGWSSDGDDLLYLDRGTRNLHAIASDSDVARVLVEEPTAITWSTLSPDGSWLAYNVGEEIVVRSYHALEDRRVITRGSSPAWTKGGTELLFVRDDEKEDWTMFALTVDPSTGRAVGEPTALFSRDDFAVPGPFRGYDVSADGDRILGILGTPPEAPPEPEIHLVLNWFEELGEGAGGR